MQLNLVKLIALTQCIGNFLGLSNSEGRAEVVRAKEVGIVQNGYESISLRPADFSLCERSCAQPWKSSLKEKHIPDPWMSSLLRNTQFLYKKWKSQFPKLCQVMLESFIEKRSNISGVTKQ
jgi:hypothetical protein